MIDLKEKNRQSTLIQNIVFELKEIPDEYLQTLYAIIHSFRTNLPEEQQKQKVKDTDDNSFDWDSLINEININRQNSNIQLNQRIENTI